MSQRLGGWRLVGSALLVLLVGIIPSIAQAGAVRILWDESEPSGFVNIVTTQDGNVIEVRGYGIEGGGFEGYFMFFGAILPTDTHLRFNIVEAAGGPVSDTLQIDGNAGNQSYVFRFQSEVDGQILAALPGGVEVVETGGIQDLFTFDGGQNVVTFAIRSDVEVPEPASLALLGLGLAGLGFSRRKQA